MSDLALLPHNDDELFCSYTLLRHHPHVVVCLKADVQKHRGTGITAEMREAETQCSMNILGCTWGQMPVSELLPDTDRIIEHLAERDYVHAPERVWTPAVEEGGHEHHNLIGQIALDVFGDRVIPYMTYRRGFGRSRGKTVVIPTPGERSLKREALNCYESQIKLENTRFWFSEESEWDKEYLA